MERCTSHFAEEISVDLCDWFPQKKLQPVCTQCRPYATFGTSVAVDATAGLALVGAPRCAIGDFEDKITSRVKGSVYLFALQPDKRTPEGQLINPALWLTSPIAQLEERTMLAAQLSSLSLSEHSSHCLKFGQSVALSQTIALIGSPGAPITTHLLSDNVQHLLSAGTAILSNVAAATVKLQSRFIVIPESQGTLRVFLSTLFPPNQVTRKTVVNYATRDGSAVGLPNHLFQYCSRLPLLAHHRLLNPMYEVEAQLPKCNNSHVSVGDFDGDGDFDLVVGCDHGQVYAAENVGTRFYGDFRLIDSAISITGSVHVPANAAPILVDIDGDGDLDLFIGDSVGEVHFYENTGSSTVAIFTLSPGTNPLSAVACTEGSSSPSFTDWDGDGDYDAVIGCGDGALQYWNNIGTINIASFSLVAGALDPFDGIIVPGFAKPSFQNVVGDNAHDLILGSGATGVTVYERSGDNLHLVSEQDNPLATLRFLKLERVSVAFADIDSDQRIDVAVGCADGCVETVFNFGFLVGKQSFVSNRHSIFFNSVCRDFRHVTGTIVWIPGANFPPFIDIRILDDLIKDEDVSKSFYLDLHIPEGPALQGKYYTTEIRIDDDDFVS